ncbi:hypothetical protein BGW42_005827 [Actinomortierella wolfii]|nr:hypothetical protein BGW42_005827 [Actinomortierella wolfii]
MASVPSLTFALIGTEWRFQSAPTDGLNDLTFPVNIANAPHEPGFFFAQQFSFHNTNEVAYTGLQPQKDQNGRSVFRSVFTSFQGGTSTNHPNCHLDGDGGPGVSCAVLIEGDYSHTYNTVVENIGGTTWRGTLVDTVTGAETITGEWTLPAGSGKIKNGQSGFVEHFIWTGEPPQTCDSLPFTEVTFYHPISETSGASGGEIAAAFEYGDCVDKVGFSRTQVNGGLEIKVGFRK